MRLLCAVAGVSRSGYYQWLKKAGYPDRDYEDYLLIKEIFNKGKGKYGWRTIQMKLKRDKGVIMNHKKIIRIKNTYGLATKIRKVNPYKAIMKKTQEHQTFNNILDRDFKAAHPHKKFCTDISYLQFNRRHAYLSAVKDLASKEVVAWNVTRHLEMDLVLDMVDNLKNNPAISSFEDIVMHSDQGFHYTNPEYINRLKELNMVQSMSRKGNCIDNAPVESFFGHFKDDADYQDCKTFTELKDKVDNYMNYYNHDRPQWNLKKMTPVEYRNHLLSAEK